jgi:hypothetical protein
MGVVGLDHVQVTAPRGCEAQAPELIPDFNPDENDRPGGRSQINDIAGAGTEHRSATVAAYRIEESWDL